MEAHVSLSVLRISRLSDTRAVQIRPQVRLLAIRAQKSVVIKQVIHRQQLPSRQQLHDEIMQALEARWRLWSARVIMSDRRVTFKTHSRLTVIDF